MTSAAMRCLALALFIAFAGCLEVESMEVTVVADAESDRLDIMIVSRGVYSSATNDNNLEKDLADLLKCRDVAAVPIPGLGVADLTTTEDDGKKRQRAIGFIDIEPGAFFIDEQDRLSFYQFVRVHRVQEFMKQARPLAQEAWQEEREKASPATQECIDAAIRDGLLPLTIDGAGFVFRAPLSLEDHREQQAALWQSLVRSIEKSVATPDGEQPADATQRGLVQLMRDNDVAVVRRVGVTEWVVGIQGSERCNYQMRGEAYQDNLLQAFQKAEPRPPTVTQALVDKQFAAFREREARVPKAFAEAKQRALKARANNKQQ